MNSNTTHLFLLIDNLIQLKLLRDDQKVIFKLTLPSVDDLYEALATHPNVVRVVALSGGFTRLQANDKLSRQHGVVASFSRALTGLKVDMTPAQFDSLLDSSILQIFNASMSSPVNRELHAHEKHKSVGVYHDVEEDYSQALQ